MSEIKIKCTGAELVPVGEIVPYVGNAKIHSEEQIGLIRSSLRTFGFVRPLLIDAAGNLIAGHGTLAAARAEGMTAVPCQRAEGLSESQRRAYILADNRLAELSAWDNAARDSELRALDELGMTPELMGFDPEELALDGPEALDLDEDGAGDKKPAQEPKVCHCPKCGFAFEVPK